jgi:phosphoglycerate dehydrogenase-like enzyme
MATSKIGRQVATRSARVPTIAVVSPLDNPALARPDRVPYDAANLLIANDIETMLEVHGEKLAEAEGLLWIPPGNPTVLQELYAGGHLPNVKWVHGFYAGVDPIASFARDVLEPAGLPLSNGRGAFSSSLAEYVICAAMHFVKQVPRCMQNRRERKWDKFVMGELRGMTMGLLGYGHIAQTTAALAKAFGMRVIALRRNADKPLEGAAAASVDLVLGPYGDGPVEPSHKAALLEQSDIVVSTLPGTPETKHFVSTAEFQAMKEGAVFISLGRGVAIDEAALDAALRSGRLGGAALDVFEVEPLPAESPLWDAVHGDRLLLTSHNADFTETYFLHGWQVWRENLDRYLNGEPLATPVDKLRGY